MSDANVIDVTPTWKGAMPIILRALESGTPKGKELAREELRDLAVKLDEMNEATRKLVRLAQFIEGSGDVLDTPPVIALLRQRAKEALELVG